MPTLSQMLQQMPYRSLRGLAIRLALRQSQEHQKASWIASILTGWQQPTQRSQWLALLSPAAQAALQRLSQAQQIPAALFWPTYGPVRQVTARQHWQPPPWQAPATVSEELYYTGLLAPLDGLPLARTQWLTIPVDLRPLLATEGRQGALRQAQRPTASDPLVTDTLITDSLTSDSLTSDPLTTASLTTDSLTTTPLLHDLAQLLIYQHSQPDFRLLHERWLTRSQVAALNARLLQPITSKPLPTPRRHPYLRLLAFLADAADLHQQGVLTPQGWAWLAAAPQEQWGLLWQSWCNAQPQQRQRYHLPAATVSPPWPQPLVQQLAAWPPNTPGSVSDLVNALLRANTTPAAFWAANFHDLADLDQIVAQTLDEVLQPLGVVAPVAAPQMANGEVRYLVSQPAREPLSPHAPAPLTSDPLTSDLLTSTFSLDLPALPHVGAAQARLALYATYTVPSQRTPQRYHRYQLTATTVARAAAAGHGLPTLIQACTDLGITFTPDQHHQLHTWHAAGRQLTLTHFPLLRTTTPAQLAAIAQERTLRPLLGEILAPTVATLTTDLATFAHHLQQAGVAGLLPEPASAVYQTPLAGALGARPSRVPQGRATHHSPVLWLAGRLYAHLGDHLPLPLPPPFAELDHLLAQLPPAQQALLHAQAQQLHEHLLQLLDNLPFTPPPHPSDPAHWRPPIEQAIAAQQRLQLTYFSAGRNLLTQRTIEPYWLEEHRRIPYLRAYCHTTGRVLTFRLDRIQALEPVSQ